MWVDRAMGFLSGAVAGGSVALAVCRSPHQAREQATDLRIANRCIAALEGIAEAGISAHDLHTVLNTLVERSARGLDADFAVIMTLDEQTREFVMRAGYNAPYHEGFRIASDKGFAGRINTDGCTVYVADVEKDPLVRNSGLKHAGAKSLAGTPLVARGRTVGMMYVGVMETREFTLEEVALLETIASRAAAAIDNAGLYEAVVRSRDELEAALAREHEFSLLLQRALLPEKPVIGEGYAVASVYVPAFAGREMSGDFYDVFRTKDGRAGILVGDVSGKGLEAASLAAGTRSMVSACAYHMASPGQSLTYASAVLNARQRDAFGGFVTVLLVVLDLDSGDISFSNAGHPPGAIRRVDGSVGFLACGQPPLTVSDELEYAEQSGHLNPGDKLVLFTDGISEARHGTEFFGLDGVERALREYGHLPPDDLAGELVAAASMWANGKLTDDAAIVIVEREQRRQSC